MIKAIIFDLDGMVHLTETLFSDKISKDHPITPQQISEFFKNEYKDCRIGKLDTKKVLQKYLDKWSFNGSVDKFQEYWFTHGSFDHDIIELIKKLRSNGVKCILCTNNDKYRMDYLKKNYGLEDIFDNIITSANEGVSKPEEKMFDIIVKVCGANPSEILFCDDRESSIIPAKEYGFKVHLYMGLDQLEAALERFGVEV